MESHFSTAPPPGRESRLFALFVEELDLVFWATDPTGRRLLYVSPHYERIFGRSADELTRNPRGWIEAVLPEDRARVARARAGAAYDVEYRIRGADGGARWIHAQGTPVRDTHGAIEAVIGFARDITALKQREEELRLLAAELDDEAQTDSLTRLLNRRALEAALGRELRRSGRKRREVSAILVDIDDFRRINDSFGLATGDLVLRGIAERMKRVLRPSDVLARLGGDEFLVLLPATRQEEALPVAERLRLAAADEGMTMAGEPVRVTASLGVAAVAPDVASIEEVLDATRVALSASKAEGKNRVVAATDEKGARLRPARPADELRRLLLEERFHAVAQSIRGLGGGEVRGYEMLSRGPEGAFQSPTDFFRASHGQNLLTAVDLQCLRACLEAARPAARRSELKFHVNLFPSTVVDTPPERVIELLERAGGVERFCIELSEQQFVGAPDDLVQPVRVLRGAGVSIGVDDVGHGRSSLETLVLLEPDVVKVAREVVCRADEDAGQRRALARLTAAVRPLAPTLIAEGVETEGEREVLGELGFELAQGFLWDRPGPLTAPRSGGGTRP
ncbi:MAG: diguanylate cyclase [Planctomycetota bacterium]